MSEKDAGSREDFRKLVQSEFGKLTVRIDQVKHAADAAATAEFPDRLTGCGVPQANRAPFVGGRLRSDCQQRAPRGKRQGADRPGGDGERSQFLAAGDVPDPDDRVVGAGRRRELAVVTDDEPVQAAMTRKPPQPFAA